MTYAELTQAIQDYLQTTESTFVTNIPVFVRQTEERINREVMIPDLRRTVTGTVTAASPYLQKPTDFLTTFSIAVSDGTDYTMLLLKDYNFLVEAYPTSATTGFPKYYAHFNDLFWRLGPVPDSGYTTDLAYYYDPESIVTASTSWLGDNAESVLLYGCLFEAYTFQKGDPDLIALYNQRYQEGIKNLIDLGMMRSKRDDYRGGELRISA